jgi:hypothetical protein
VPELLDDTLPGLLDTLRRDYSEHESAESADAAQGSGRLAARLPDGAGYLVIDGPGAGSVVRHSGDGQIIKAAPLPTRDQALDAALPMFIVHRGHAYSQSMPRLLAHIHAAAGGNVTLGIVSELRQATEQALRDFNDSCRAAAIRIVDPVCYLAGPQQELRVKTPSPKAMRNAPYLGGSPATAAEILAMQRARGANLLLTPGRTLDPAAPQRSLDVACAEGDDALAALKPGERLALSLTMSATWLVNESLRQKLLGQLLDQQQFDTWYVRVQWPGVKSYTQPVSKELLAGYRELAELAANEDRQLLLPQTGLTGWIMLAYGATGFGTGITGTLQAFLESSDDPRRGHKIERYFERRLLHTIERTARAPVIADPAYARCACPYCRQLFDGGWSEQYAGLHYLFNVGTLTAEVAASVAGRGGTHGAVRQKVRSARKFADGKALTGGNVPKHLDIWDQSL